MFMMQAEDLFFIPHNKECLCIDIQVLAGLKFDRDICNLAYLRVGL